MSFQRCLACGREGAPSRCGGCKIAFFCNVECQREAWPSHKLQCTTTRTAPTPKAASSSDALNKLASHSLKHLSDLVFSLAESGEDHRLSHLPPGSFRELVTKPASFLQLAYPGVSPKDLQGSGVSGPLTLKELFTGSMLSEARHEAALRACTKGKSIIDSVKSKALAAGGPQMDEATEKQLWPQVFAEAFCREIPSIIAKSSSSEARSRGHEPGRGISTATPKGAPAVRITTGIKSIAVETASDLMASPFHVLAASSYLADETLSSLFARSTATTSIAGELLRSDGGVSMSNADRAPLLATLEGGFATQKGPFLGDKEEVDAWSTLVLDDCLRMAEEEARWSPAVVRNAKRSFDKEGMLAGEVLVETESSYAWLNDGELEDEAPALSEELQRLHALPYELSRKVPGLRLLKPRPGTALLRRIRVKASIQPFTAAEEPPAPAGQASFPLRMTERNPHGDGEGNLTTSFHLVIFPHGEDFLPNAPAATAPETSDRPPDSAFPVQLTVMGCIGKHTAKRQKGTLGATGGQASDTVSSLAPPTAQFSLQLSEKSTSDGPLAEVPASQSNTLVLHRTQALLYRPAVHVDIKLSSVKSEEKTVITSPASVESQFFFLSTFIRGPPDEKVFLG
jgi:MYND finger